MVWYGLLIGLTQKTWALSIHVEKCHTLQKKNQIIRLIFVEEEEALS